MSAGTIEVANDEGGDDRRREVAVERLQAMLSQTLELPTTVDDAALEAFLREAAEVNAQQQPADAQTEPEDTPAPPVTPEGGRAIYGYEPNPRKVGNVALAALNQSRGFTPAGTHFFGDQTSRFLPFEKRPVRGPRINGVYRSW